MDKRKSILSVCLSCKGILSLLEKSLKSLQEQDLDFKLWDLVLLVPEKQKSNIMALELLSVFESVQIINHPLDKPLYSMKNQALEQVETDILYFIDEDVILKDQSQLSKLVKEYQRNPHWAVIGGAYLNHPESSFFGRSYNWLTSLWCLAHPYYIPAGNLSVQKKLVKPHSFYSPHPAGFGGEEVYFLEKIKEQNLPILASHKFAVWHLAKHKAKDFYKRAFYHGYSFFLQKDKNTLKESLLLFWNTPESWIVKTVAITYLLLVRFTALIYYKVKKTTY